MTNKNNLNEIKAITDQFYQALNTLFIGNATPMKAIWAHSDDAAYMGPDGGVKRGWEAISAVWDFQANARLGGEVIPDHDQIIAGEDLAITTNFEVGENKNAEIGFQKVSIRATNVFRKESGVWKMISHHTDLLPFLI